MNVAIITDSLVSFGGDNRVLLTLLELYPEAEIFTSIFNPDAFPMLDSSRVHTSFLQKWPFQRFLYRHYTPLSPIAFEQFDLSGYELVISLSAGCAKGVITRPETLHVGVILTPPRYQWGGEANLRGSLLRSTFRFGMPAIETYLRMWDKEAILRPDVLVTISKFIQWRTKRIYNLDSTVIYPGIDLKFWKPNLKVKREDFYLVVSRLFDYKRIDLAIEACGKLGKKLIIIGTGPAEKYLKSLASSKIEFLGFLSDDVVREYMQKCKAFIFPGIEDFGLTPVEAMACGSPVIAYNKGGVTETVVDGKTGIFFEEQTVASLVNAIKKFEKLKFRTSVMSERVSEFSDKIFSQKFKKFVNAEFKKRQKT